MATTRSAATMAAPTTAVWLRRSRRSPSANGDSPRAAVAGHAAAARGSSASRRLPPLIGFVMVSSRVADARVQERVGEIDEQVDHHEGERGDQREALNPP